ncbi:GspE/PulE family protein [Thiohalorhabdus sp.]|uniref:GspE/PulE family protein n=1 Tax=Thiohalorhabdus sp. TaxID=3094134 RepID=UPI002FC3DEB7
MNPRTSDLIRELRHQGLVTEAQLEAARTHAGSHGVAVEEALVETGAIGEDRLLQIAGDLYGIPVADLDQIPLDDHLVSLVPERTARRYLALPLYRKGHEIYVAMAQAWDVSRVDEVRFSIGRSIQPVLAPREQLREKLDELFTPDIQGAEKSAASPEETGFLEDALSHLEGAESMGGESQEGDGDTQQLLRESSASPIVKIVNDIFIRAIHKGASDIHMEPQEANVIVRYRVDGALREAVELPGKAHNAIVSRIKVLAGMDISVARRPKTAASSSITGATRWPSGCPPCLPTGARRW